MDFYSSLINKLDLITKSLQLYKKVIIKAQNII